MTVEDGVVSIKSGGEDFGGALGPDRRCDSECRRRSCHGAVAAFSEAFCSEGTAPREGGLGSLR